MRGQSFEMTLKLKLEGDVLTGAMVGRNGKETPIQDGTYKDGDLSFKVVRERNGQKITTKYAGKVSDNTIKGKIESDFGAIPEAAIGSQTRFARAAFLKVLAASGGTAETPVPPNRCPRKPGRSFR